MRTYDSRSTRPCLRECLPGGKVMPLVLCQSNESIEVTTPHPSIYSLPTAALLSLCCPSAAQVGSISRCTSAGACANSRTIGYFSPPTSCRSPFAASVPSRSTARRGLEAQGCSSRSAVAARICAAIFAWSRGGGQKRSSSYAFRRASCARSAAAQPEPWGHSQRDRDAEQRQRRCRVRVELEGTYEHLRRLEVGVCHPQNVDSPQQVLRAAAALPAAGAARILRAAAAVK